MAMKTNQYTKKDLLLVHWGNELSVFVDENEVQEIIQEGKQWLEKFGDCEDMSIEDMLDYGFKPNELWSPRAKRIFEYVKANQ